MGIENLIIVALQYGVGRLRQSIVGDFRSPSEVVRKCLENAQRRPSGLRNNFGKSSKSGRKSSENRQKRRYQHVYHTLARRYEFYVLVAKTISSEQLWLLFGFERQSKLVDYVCR